MSDLQTYTHQLESMMKLAQDVQILKSDAVPTFAALPYANYAELIDLLEDLQDRLTLAQARAEDDGTRIPIEDVMREFGI